MRNKDVKIVDKPPVFRDDKDRDWTIRLNLQLLDDVHQLAGIDLVPEGNNVTAISALVVNTRKLGEVLWILCQRQAESKQIDQRSFKEGLEANGLSRGWEAMVNSILFFIQSQSPGMAKAVQEIIEKEMEVMEAGMAQMLGVLQGSEVDAALKETAKRIGEEMKTGVLNELANSAIPSRA